MDSRRGALGRAVHPYPRLAVFYIGDNKRSRALAEAACCGAAAIKAPCRAVDARYYSRPIGEVAVFYGYDGSLERVFRDYRQAGKAVVYIDLGYWGRREGGVLAGYHKVAVNARHPTAYFRDRVHGGDRAARLGLSVSDWQPGRYILLAGMSAKAAKAEGFAPTQWERAAIETIRRHTDRPIIYRPKPSWKEAEPIPGTIFEPGIDDLPDLLSDCHAVVTHHSNAAIDGLLAGVPAFCMKGAASVMALQDLAKIESPWRPDGREQFVNDLSWCQFNVEEIANGAAFRHLEAEGLI